MCICRYMYTCILHVHIYVYRYIYIYMFIYMMASIGAPPTFPHVPFLSHLVSEALKRLQVPSSAIQVLKTHCRRDVR